ncbi:MAG: peptidoglycan-binding protein, partial [Rhodobacteraceae bacterium]|nr:peptidoglycan-binding protein [Paracoccaceae bacterium]
MALRRGGGQRFNPIIWPGFVDAMTGLLLVLMFVLTIFTVVQFVLRDTITGQQHELSDLTGEVAELASALGFERDRSATLAQQIGSLSQSLSLSNNEAEAQAVMILSLTSERNVQAEALSTAQSRITGFEAQIAGLMQQRSSAQDMIASLEADSAAATAQIAGLQDSAAASALCIASLRDAGTAADARIAGLEADGASATAQIAGLQADSAAATARIAGFWALSL